MPILHHFRDAAKKVGGFQLFLLLQPHHFLTAYFLMKLFVRYSKPPKYPI